MKWSARGSGLWFCLFAHLPRKPRSGDWARCCYECNSGISCWRVDRHWRRRDVGPVAPLAKDQWRSATGARAKAELKLMEEIGKRTGMPGINIRKYWRSFEGKATQMTSDG